MERNKPPELLLGFSTRKAANSKTGDITFHQLNKMRIGILNLPPTWSAQSFLLSSSSPPCTMGNRFWRSGRGWAERHLAGRLTSATNIIVKDPKGCSPVQPPHSPVSCFLKSVLVLMSRVNNIIQLQIYVGRSWQALNIDSLCKTCIMMSAPMLLWIWMLRSGVSIHLISGSSKLCRCFRWYMQLTWSRHRGIWSWPLPLLSQPTEKKCQIYGSIRAKKENLQERDHLKTSRISKKRSWPAHKPTVAMDERWVYENLVDRSTCEVLQLPQEPQHQAWNNKVGSDHPRLMQPHKKTKCPNTCCPDGKC